MKLPNVRVSYSEISRLLLDSLQLLQSTNHGKLEINGKMVKLPSEGEAIIVGDLHGDYQSLEKILSETRFEDNLNEHPDQFIVFLGDYIDRGEHQIEVITRILKLYVENPNNVVLLRGNHEGPDDVHFRPHDFPIALRERFGEEGDALYTEFRRLFNELYVAVLREHEVLMLHGCLPSHGASLEDMADSNRTHPRSKTLIEMLWNDPSDDVETTPSPRGIGFKIGKRSMDEMLNRLGVNTLIRSHESVIDGHKVQGRVVTIFSSKFVYHNERGSYMKISLAKNRGLKDPRQYVNSF